MTDAFSHAALVASKRTRKKDVRRAIRFLMENGSYDGGHHKQWTMDQVLRIMTRCPTVTRTAGTSSHPYEYEALGESPEYTALVAAFAEGEDGPDTYEWDEGIPP